MAKPVRREKQFLTQLKASFQERGAFFFKIPDMPHFEGAKFRFDIPKPFDAIAQFAGQAFAIEAKVTTKIKAVGLRDLRQCQIDGLNEWQRTGGKGFVFVYIWQQGRREIGLSAVYRVYIFPWEEFKAAGRYTKAELLALPHIPRYTVKTSAGLANHYRFNLDEFLINLVM